MAPHDRKPMTFPPALPEPRGADERKVAFFREVAAGLEFMALWHSLDVEAQTRLRDAIHSAAAESAVRSFR